MLNKSDKSGRPCLVPDLRENAFNFSLLSMMLADVGLSYVAFIMLRHLPSILTLWSCLFYYKWMLDFVKRFLCIYTDDHMVFILQFLNVVYHID